MAANAKHVTTVANTEQTVTLSGDYQTVDVVNVSGASAVYCRSDSVAATVKGDECDVAPAGVGAFCTLAAPGASTVVSIISAVATDVAIIGRLK